MNLKKQKPTLAIILWIMTIAGIFLALKSSSEQMLPILKDTWIESFFHQFNTGNLIIFNFSIGFIVSIFLYLLVVWYPKRQRKILIKRNFEQQYISFKHDTISIFLLACNKSYNIDLVSKLSKISEFRCYFKEQVSDSQERWHAVLNGLEEYHLKELLVELEIFMNEVSYVLNNVEINDPNVFSFFKRLSQIVYKLKNSKLDYEDVKQLSRFYWELFAGWSIIEGYKDEDIVKVMIEKI